jgi:CDP-paratose 2-epimerase
LQGQPITLYGDGFQVRDVLFVKDLIDALLLAQENIHLLSGQAFNIGGGPEHTVSLLELINRLEGLLGQEIPCQHESPRPGDQLFYVSDHRKFQDLTGWSPLTSIDRGLEKLLQWLVDSRPATFVPRFLHQRQA